MLTKAAFLLFALAGIAAPQEPTGAIVGLVQDSSEAIVPCVEVTAEKIDTSARSTDLTNEKVFTRFRSCRWVRIGWQHDAR